MSTVIYTNGTGGGNWADTATWAGGVVPQYALDQVANIVAGDVIYNIPTGEVILENNGAIQQNDGLVIHNTATGNIDTNYLGIIQTNDGSINTNSNIIQINNNYVNQNNGTVIENNGTVDNNDTGGIINKNYGIVTTNNGLVYVWNNTSTITTNNGTVYLATSGASVNGFSVSPVAFSDPLASNVTYGTIYYVGSDNKFYGTKSDVISGGINNTPILGMI